MSLFGSGHQGITLRALLQNPDLQNPPSINRDFKDLEKNGSQASFPSSGSAFLGPNLWDKPSSDSAGDLDLEYMDLDEFLSENGIPVNPGDVEFEDPTAIGLLADALTGSNAPSPTDMKIKIPSPLSSPQMSPQPPVMAPQLSPMSSTNYLPERSLLSPGAVSCSPCHSPPSVDPNGILPTPGVSPKSESPVSKEGAGKTCNQLPSVDFKVDPQDIPLVSIPACSEMLGTQSPSGSPAIQPDFPCPQSPNVPSVLGANIPGQDGFDPKCRKFTDDELKPQPMIKKSRKVFVADDSKDEKYWSRRKKNNIAAKRSRDARRVKENQIAMRASFLEKENDTLKTELKKLQMENQSLQKRLAKYESAS